MHFVRLLLIPLLFASTGPAPTPAPQPAVLRYESQGVHAPVAGAGPSLVSRESRTPQANAVAEPIAAAAPVMVETSAESDTQSPVPADSARLVSELSAESSAQLPPIEGLEQPGEAAVLVNVEPNVAEDDADPGEPVRDDTPLQPEMVEPFPVTPLAVEPIPAGTAPVLEPPPPPAAREH